MYPLDNMYTYQNVKVVPTLQNLYKGLQSYPPSHTIKTTTTK